mmetsp:Transcript_6454/g.9375  ORF Transcript_6454/g.9375 Transcript_6454/m.9375 type:complete len:116 (-) Transcript_6454:153-500(-)|eukprot:CAMPEP_0184855492 /NCGR_PEP_ID=MMETSP0580-20130426/725_1 /TAXON_ID=1118495 /ORGANISM="Dactyliosolen fragilissimus" /LENGTH=115 /DNA_ID=CAMNT_0027350017 /DNA_START=79 /DNA_END=426 /DNA_ORIENTATION=+
MTFADSVNLARRLTSHNEPDLLQENMLKTSKNYDECSCLAKKISSVKDLPVECHIHKDIVRSVIAKSSSKENAIAFQGMGSAAAAHANARGQGRESYAQIQRRYTNTRRFTKEQK